MPCDKPVWIKAKGTDMPVPCGKCAPCKIRRVNEWVFRVMWEEEHNSVSSHFVTLTYDTNHVPLTPNGFMTLRKDDFQNYMKRLRHLCEPSLQVLNDYCGRSREDRYSLKYYACGEYGSQFKRPHYHAIILNCQDEQYFADAWALDGIQFGDVKVGTCTTDSVAYCMKYIDKESFRARVYKHSRDDRLKEFSLMSKNLGVGYCTYGTAQYHAADLSRNYLTKVGGYRIAMPRYYRMKIFTEDERDAQRLVIEQAVAESDRRARAEHLASNLPYSYIRKLELDREGREYKFRQSQKRRGDP